MTGLHEYFCTKFAMMLVRRIARRLIGPKLKPIRLPNDAPKPVIPGFTTNKTLDNIESRGKHPRFYKKQK